MLTRSLKLLYVQACHLVQFAQRRPLFTVSDIQSVGTSTRMLRKTHLESVAILAIRVEHVMNRLKRKLESESNK